jgi:hypothetical protein
MTSQPPFGWPPNGTSAPSSGSYTPSPNSSPPHQSPKNKRSGCLVVVIGLVLAGVTLVLWPLTLLVGVGLITLGVLHASGRTQLSVAGKIWPSLNTGIGDIGIGAILVVLGGMGYSFAAKERAEREVQGRAEVATQTAEVERQARDTDGDGVRDLDDCAPGDSAQAVSRSQDADCDGFLDGDDCNPAIASVNDGRLQDLDCDGIPNTDDCGPEDETILTRRSTDADCDTILDGEDCDPNGQVDDLDCDGVGNALDCDENNPTITTTAATDNDCDGVVNDADCGPDDATLKTARSDDRDCDGITNADDCDPDGHMGDRDCDDVQDSTDCDPDDANIATDQSLDNDCDGIPDDEDCAPRSSANDSASCLMPASQVQFCNIISESRENYQNADRNYANELQLSTIRRDRGVALERAVSRRRFSDWYGTLYDIGTNSEGRGFVSIRFDCNDTRVTLSTADNAFTDIVYNSMISPSSEMYTEVSRLSTDDAIVFSGQFFDDVGGPNGFATFDLTEAGTMRDPHLVARFGRIRSASP